MEEEAKTYLLSIAGFDPSGGAGILADIKTFEANKVIGLGVCTAITFQNDSEFEGLNWISADDIKKQIEVLFKKFQINWVKIGLIQNLAVLDEVIDYLKEKNSAVNIIWDSIIKASAGFIFHQSIDQKLLTDICKKLYLITPNLEEMEKLIPGLTPEKGAGQLSKYCNVLLKGGHKESDKARDLLFENGLITIFESEKISSSKHGTGCVLSSAILTNLAKGYDLKSACREGKDYVTDFIRSDSGLLGFHYV
jgi:hydroxymethylpyrimidine/phosphomethylpyrimidine kinase